MTESLRLDLVVLGAGATGLELADLVRAGLGDEVMIGAVDDDFSGDERMWKERNIPLLGDRSILPTLDAPYLVGVGHTRTLADLATAAASAGLRPAAPVAHETSVCAPGVALGPGVVLYPLCALSTNVSVGRQSLIMLTVTLGHDVVVGEGCVITPGVNVGGQARIGDRVFIGSGAVILPRVRIGNDVVIGAGAVVTRDLPDGVVAVGNPARPRG